MRETNELLKSFGISKPSLLLDKHRILGNIDRMTSKAKASGVRFRPHFKTHQSEEIGNWFRNFGVTAITVSSLDMAMYFAKYGWSDITVAFITNVLELNKINELAGKIKLNLLVDSERVLSILNQHLKYQVGMWVKIDTGYHRTGVLWDDIDTLRSLTKTVNTSPLLDFRGLLTHAGHSYRAKSLDEIHKIHKETVSRMLSARDYIRDIGIETCEISVGDTPTCSIVDDFAGVDEIRPGNFVFYDLMQEKLGSCTDNDIAVAVACPVVGKYEDRNQIVIYGGAVHLSNAYIPDENSRQIFGYLTDLRNGTFSSINRDAPVVSLTQEHGIVSVNDEFFNEVDMADFVFVFPVHSCLTCNLYKEYHSLQGEIISRL